MLLKNCNDFLISIECRGYSNRMFELMDKTVITYRKPTAWVRTALASRDLFIFKLISNKTTYELPVGCSFLFTSENAWISEVNAIRLRSDQATASLRPCQPKVIVTKYFVYNC